MSWWAVGISAVSIGTQALGQQGAKKAAKADAEFEAQQLESAAGRDRASGQRRAAEERRQARLVESALQARSGGGLDPTIAKLQSDIAGEGEYRALTALYEGEESARGKLASADATRRTGRARGQAADLQSFGTILGGAGSLYSKYGGTGGQFSDRSSFRSDDPYRNRFYVGGSEGE